MDPRRIRVFFSDPDATDSDSGDSDACATTKPAGKTILILQCNSSTNTRAKMNPAGCGRPQAIGSSAPAAVGSSRNRAVGSAPTTRRYRGVYERQPGRLKVRHWVGTFATEEEAKAAYDAFERRFHSSPRCGPPASSLERGANAGAVRRASHPPPDEKRQIVLALMTAATTRMLPPSSAGAMAASVSVPPAPCDSSSMSASPPPTLFRDARRRDEVPRSLHSLWADEPADEDLDLVGLADLAHLPLPRFSDPNMDFDPADLSLFDNGFL
ncbi:dehydration-responsive element-binding protein 1E-like [Panicum miliaceum]|uniref:Dehydration-responsive element-binding protein 1E-like n=1 Tax=Panicum miliaceum TaxID=4540 RepID=A0A3L6RIH9_PANMI|nr:dehydration-responsive element-binding protein 1E-like [Panicum miliaceum]